MVVTSGVTVRSPPFMKWDSRNQQVSSQCSIIQRVPADDGLILSRRDDPAVRGVVVGEVGGRNGQAEGARLARLKRAECRAWPIGHEFRFPVSFTPFIYVTRAARATVPS